MQITLPPAFPRSPASHLCAQGASVIGACLPGHPVAPNPRSRHRPPPSFPGQRDRAHVVQISEPGGKPTCQWWRREAGKTMVAQKCPGAVTSSCHWIKTAPSILCRIIVPPLGFSLLPWSWDHTGSPENNQGPSQRKQSFVSRTSLRTGPLSQCAPTILQGSKVCTMCVLNPKNSPMRI